jgi:hypothetical protein
MQTHAFFHLQKFRNFNLGVPKRAEEGDQNNKGAFADWFKSCFGICSRIAGAYWVILALQLPECLPKFCVN